MPALAPVIANHWQRVISLGLLLFIESFLGRLVSYARQVPADAPA
jgi:hypothetical protein